jgi:hypothetical protein
MEWDISYLNRRLLYEYAVYFGVNSLSPVNYFSRPFKKISYDKAVSLQEQFLKTIWPGKLNEIRALGRLPSVKK